MKLWGKFHSDEVVVVVPLVMARGLDGERPRRWQSDLSGWGEFERMNGYVLWGCVKVKN